MTNTDINLKKLDDRCTLKVNLRITKELKLRMAIAKLLLRAASWVLGGEIEFNECEVEPDEEKN